MRNAKSEKAADSRAVEHAQGIAKPVAAASKARPDVSLTRVPEIQTIERASRLLGLFSNTTSHLSLNELSAGLGLGKATTHRYAMSLRSVGLLGYSQETALYTIGPRIVELAAAAQAGLSYADIAEPYMTRLCAKVGETVVLTAWERTDPIIVRVCVGTARDASVLMRVGTRLGKYSAHYRIWLAYGAEKSGEERRKAMIENELDRIKEQGIAIISKGGLRAFACPIFQGKELMAAISIVSIAETTPNGPNCVISKQLKETASAISKELTGLSREP